MLIKFVVVCKLPYVVAHNKSRMLGNVIILPIDNLCFVYCFEILKA